MKPILFSTPMVQAILDGRKSQTRRFVKGLPDDQSGCGLGVIKRSDGVLTGYGFETMPYQPGQILWVRETWTPFCINKRTCRNNLLSHSDYCYKASPEQCVDDLPCKWRPSIFMPREAARIWLRVTDVSVKRLQGMDADDARAEGMFDCAETDFADLWDSLNAKRGYSWASNPWVFVISFERCEKPQEGELK